MNMKVVDTSCAQDNTRQRRSSEAERQKTAKMLISGTLEDYEFRDVLCAVIFRFCPVHNQRVQCQTVGSYLGVDTETVRRWMHGHTTPKMQAVWPLFAWVMLEDRDCEDQKLLWRSIVGDVE